VIPEEMRAEFDAFRAGLLKASDPQTVIEEQYFRRLLLHGWNLRRVQDAETQHLLDGGLSGDPAAEHRLQLLARYRRDLERSYDRALKELRDLQSLRVARAATPGGVRRLFQEAAPLGKPAVLPGLSYAELTAILDDYAAPPVVPPLTLPTRNEAIPARAA
jgi:hypothetical protein